MTVYPNISKPDKHSQRRLQDEYKLKPLADDEPVWVVEEIIPYVPPPPKVFPALHVGPSGPLQGEPTVIPALQAKAKFIIFL